MISALHARSSCASLNGMRRSRPGWRHRHITGMPCSRNSPAQKPGSSRQKTYTRNSAANARLICTTSFSVPPGLSAFTTYANAGRLRRDAALRGSTLMLAQYCRSWTRRHEEPPEHVQPTRNCVSEPYDENPQLRSNCGAQPLPLRHKVAGTPERVIGAADVDAGLRMGLEEGMDVSVD